MAKEVKVSIIVDDNGTMRLTEKSAKKLGTGMDRVGKSAASADRQLKGAAQASSNTSKNFSKMAQGITGGLVPAYATFAANIFAITAVFQAFKNAADITNLIEGQKALGAATGVAYKTVTNSLREATDGMLSFKEAASATAIGTSAGLSSGQLQGLATAAKNASAVLGRDLTDSFNRLVRGVTKAEPELLDELGIILRLDTATENYKNKMGILGRELTTFEKQQAVANEVLTQAEAKYAAIEETIDPAGQAINRLAASFDQLLIPLQTFATKLVAPVFNFLSDNLLSFGALLTSVGVGFVKAFTPAIPTMRQLGASVDDAKTAVLSLGNKSNTTIKNIKKSGDISAGQLKILERAAKAKTSKVLKFENSERRTVLRNIAIIKAQHKTMIAENMRGFSRYFALVSAGYARATAESGKFLGTLKFIGAGLGKVLNALPWIGLALLIFDLGKQIYNFFNPISEELKKANEKADKYRDTLASLNEEIENSIKLRPKISQSLSAIAQADANTLASVDLVKQIAEFSTLEGASAEKIKDSYSKLISVFDKVAKLNPQLEKFRKEIKSLSAGAEVSDLNTRISFVVSRIIEGGQALRAWGDNIRAINSEFRELFSGTKDPFSAFLENTNSRLVDLSAGLSATSTKLTEINNQKSALTNELASLLARPGTEEEQIRRRRLINSERKKKGLGSLSDNQLNNQLLTSDNKKRINEIKELLTALNVEIGNGTKEFARQNGEVILAAKYMATANTALQSRKGITAAINFLENEQRKNRTLGITLEQKEINFQQDRKALTLDVLKALKEKKSAQDIYNGILRLGEKAEKGQLAAAEQNLEVAKARLRQVLNENELKREQINLNERLAIQENDILAFKQAEETARQEVVAATRRLAEVETRTFGLDRKITEQRYQRFLLDSKLTLAEAQKATAQERVNDLTEEGVVFSERETQSRKAALDVAKDNVRNLEHEILLLQRRSAIYMNNVFAETESLRLQNEGLSLSPLQQAVNDAKLAALFSGIEMTEENIALIEQEAKAQYQIKEIIDQKKALMNSFSSSLQTGIQGIIEGTMNMKQAFASMAKSVLSALAEILAKMIAIKIIESSLAFFTPKTPVASPSSLAGLDVFNSGSAIPTTSTFSLGGRNGGIFSNGKKMGGYAEGGIAKGSASGYPAMLHGTEAVVPLPDGKSIPVSMQGGANTNNVTVNVSMAESSSDSQSQSDSQQGMNIGKLIAGVVQDELHRQKRPGGILSPYGAA